MRCCANCEWSISPDLEEEIIEEQNYEDDDINLPRAGDCAIGMQHNENFVCDKHIYTEGIKEYHTDCFYDDRYFGNGYLIVQQLDNEIVKFIKISDMNNFGFPYFMIRGYEKDSYDKDTEEFRKIEFVISEIDNTDLYDCFKDLYLSLKEQKISSIDSENQGRNNFMLSNYDSEIKLSLFKDIYGVKEATNFINIDIGDADTCTQYKEILTFYKNLSHIAQRKTTDKTIKRLLKIGNN